MYVLKTFSMVAFFKESLVSLPSIFATNGQLFDDTLHLKNICGIFWK